MKIGISIGRAIIDITKIDMAIIRRTIKIDRNDSFKTIGLITKKVKRGRIVVVNAKFIMLNMTMYSKLF